MSAIRELLETAVRLKASDIHITVGLPPVLRIGAEFRRLGDTPLTPSVAEKPRTGSVSQGHPVPRVPIRRG